MSRIARRLYLLAGVLVPIGIYFLFIRSDSRRDGIDTVPGTIRSELAHIFREEQLAAKRCLKDANRNGKGEYLSLNELAKTGTISPQYLVGTTGQSVINQYRFTLYLPTGPSSAIDGQQVSAGSGVDVDLAEEYFVVYAIPINHEDGHRPFAITQDGALYEMTKQPEPASWDAIFRVASWGSMVDVTKCRMVQTIRTPGL